MSPLVADTGIELRPDPSRVVTRFFVAGQEDVGPGDSRAGPVIRRVLGLDERDVEATMRDIDARFSHRHRGFHDTLEAHAHLVGSRIGADVELSPARRLLLGATFTHEYAIEAAALCNPSIVALPRDTGGGSGADGDDVAFVLSVRGIGEGHRSSIGFRTGTLAADGTVSIDVPGPYPHTSTTSPGPNHRSVLHAKLAEVDDDHENAAYVLDRLPDAFTEAELEARIGDLADDVATRRHPATTIAHLRASARSAYRVVFDPSTEISERVLWPRSPAEAHGMEDARFVRFTDDDGTVTYYATYTAFDGTTIAQHLLQTTDFATFDVSPMAGAAAAGKGLALFPRKIGGRYVALSRADRETNAVTFSDDLRCWHERHLVQAPERPWESLQLGNCGSPIETDAGWLVLTHGVGAMRTYSIGAVLLDLDDPRVVLATSAEPILAPSDERRDGYVPNVVYTCGALAHRDTLVVPYGVGDQTIAVATLSISRLVGSLVASPSLPGSSPDRRASGTRIRN